MSTIFTFYRDNNKQRCLLLDALLEQVESTAY